MSKLVKYFTYANFYKLQFQWGHGPLWACCSAQSVAEIIRLFQLLQLLIDITTFLGERVIKTTLCNVHTLQFTVLYTHTDSFLLWQLLLHFVHFLGLSDIHYCVNWANRSWDVYCLVYLTFVDGKFAVEGKDLLGWAGYVRSILYILSSHSVQLIPYLRNYAQVTSLCHLIWASSVF